MQPSSTSSSESDGFGVSPWAVVIVAGIALALAAAWEGLLTLRQAPRAAPAHDELLALDRAEQPAAPDKRRVLFLGSSRTYCDVVPTEFVQASRDATDVRLVALSASSSVEILKAIDDSIHDGDIVVLEVLPVSFYGGLATPLSAQMSARAAMIREHRLFEDWCDNACSGLRIADSQNAPANLIHMQIRELLGYPEPRSEWQPFKAVPREDGWVAFVMNTPERKRHADREQKTAETMQVMQRASGERAERRFRQVLAHLLQLVRSVRARGAEVYVVRFPSSGLVLEYEQTEFPREKFWDVLAAEFPGCSVNALDVPELKTLYLPDGSHLEEGNARIFTRWLAAWLQERTSLHKP
ncbi:MAG: hypothetical protein IT464_07995 [Planctomycetes bacterium]|nr:hypothetical protein [Planctomycetota bacterium]